MLLYSASGGIVYHNIYIYIYMMSERIAYSSIFCLRVVSFCFYIQPSRVYPIEKEIVSGRIVYAPIFGLRAVSLCS